jgi:hypothetical protein
MCRYFLPSANPDGYAFSWDENRMWRKTRSDYGSIVDCKVGHKENILKGGGYCFARKQLLGQITVPLLCYKVRKKVRTVTSLPKLRQHKIVMVASLHTEDTNDRNSSFVIVINGLPVLG